jgi:NAD(P)-dependent dehydrogenase (short-subunit alcohol dehydrogenase family)
LENRVVLITGATDGIGKQTAIELANKGFHIIIHGRTKERSEAALNEIRSITGSNTLSLTHADLSSLTQVRKLAENVMANYSNLDVLINNAGIYMKERTLSEDGYEMTFAVNHLSHFLLTNLLLDLLKKSDDGRIVNVSSVAHQNAKMDWNNLNSEKSFSAYGTYSLSKLANVLFSKELALRLKGTNLKSNSLHPGVITTKLLKAGFNITGASVKKGAETSVFLASSEEAASLNGEYLVDCNVATTHPSVNDTGVLKRFWDLSEAMTALN